MMRLVMSFLGNINSRMVAYEKKLEEMTDASSAHIVFTVPPDASSSRATNKGEAHRRPSAPPPDIFPDVAESIQARVANRLKRTQTWYNLTDDDTASEGEETTTTCKKHGLKSGLIRTADILVTKKTRCLAS